jgi:hypothetical protein
LRLKLACVWVLFFFEVEAGMRVGGTIPYPSLAEFMVGATRRVSGRIPYLSVAHLLLLPP